MVEADIGDHGDVERDGASDATDGARMVAGNFLHGVVDWSLEAPQQAQPTFGTTTVNLFSEDGVPVGLLAVEVGADVADMQRSIRDAVPSSSIKVGSVNGRIRLSGTVTDQVSMDKVLQVVDQYGSPSVIKMMVLTANGRAFAPVSTLMPSVRPSPIAV